MRGRWSGSPRSRHRSPRPHVAAPLLARFRTCASQNSGLRSLNTWLTSVVLPAGWQEKQLGVPAATVPDPWVKVSMLVLLSLLVPTWVVLKDENGNEPAMSQVDP